jgi:hypothetical protein
VASILQTSFQTKATVGLPLQFNMESNITDEQYFGTDLQLSEPHFDEEATLLSARPVVRLSDVRTEARSGKRLAFGLAMVIAVMAGAFAASLIYKQPGQKEATAIVETGPPLPQSAVSPTVARAQPLSGAGGAISDSNASPLAESVDDLATRGERSDSTGSETRKPGRLKEILRNGASNLPDDRELRRQERREARRLRRIAEQRGTRDHKNQSSDDLLRIREIFEGSPRP